MIPVSTLYDEYIERRKFTEQKKPSWVYSSSPLKRVGTMRWDKLSLMFLGVKADPMGGPCLLDNQTSLNILVYSENWKITKKGIYETLLFNKKMLVCIYT